MNVGVGGTGEALASPASPLLLVACAGGILLKFLH